MAAGAEFGLHVDRHDVDKLSACSAAWQGTAWHGICPFAGAKSPSLSHTELVPRASASRNLECNIRLVNLGTAPLTSWCLLRSHDFMG
jgi:hypothetical protein